MSHWYFTIRPLTPIHIGTSELLEPYEYAILDKRLYLLDLDRFLMALPRREALAFADMTGRNLAEARAFLQRHTNLVQAHARYSCPATNAVVQHYEERLDDPLSDLTVRPTIRAGKSAILPGSSVKGAIRTALLYDRISKPLYGYRDRREQTFRASQELQRAALEYNDPLDDPLKALKISDTLPPYGDAGMFQLAEVHVYKGGRWGETRRGRLIVRLETTSGSLESKNGWASQHQVQVDEKWQQQTNPNFCLEMGGLVAACRGFYDEHLAGEADFMRTFPESATVYATLQDWRKEMPDNAFLLRLGWGSGLDGVSINRALASPKPTISRRLLEGGVPLGWAEVQVFDGNGQPFQVPVEADHPPEELDEQLPEVASVSLLSDLRAGMVLEGTIVDVFGPDAVVNVGVERPGTMEKSAMGGRIVRRGDRVRVEVISVELERNRFGLRLMEVIR
jgi:hypothetical protein